MDFSYIWNFLCQDVKWMCSFNSGRRDLCRVAGNLLIFTLAKIMSTNNKEEIVNPYRDLCTGQSKIIPYASTPGFF